MNKESHDINTTLYIYIMKDLLIKTTLHFFMFRSFIIVFPYNDNSSMRIFI